MGARGPKSETEKQALAIVPAVLPERPPPPAHLDAQGQARWRELVSELPVKRFRASDLELLAQLVLCERYVHECDANIGVHGQIIGPGVQENPAVRLRERHLRAMIALQRALRLCPSMRQRQDDAELQAKSLPGRKPWEA